MLILKGENMKNICAIFCLDDLTKKRIQNYRDLLTNEYDIPRQELYPHITLAHYLEISQNEIIKYSERFIEKVNSFTVQYNSIEVLSGNCIALRIENNDKIVDLYDRYHLKFDSHCDIWTKKENELWIPHSTIYGKSESRLEDMKAYLKEKFVPFEGKIVGFELSVIKNDGFEIIFSKELG